MVFVPSLVVVLCSDVATLLFHAPTATVTATTTTTAPLPPQLHRLILGSADSQRELTGS